jgi:hypothetical protein
VTGLATAAVQVAVTCVVGEAERWTEGSLTIQLEFTCAAVFSATHWPLPVNRPEALKVALLAGAAAVWSTVMDPGVTLNAVNVQLDEEVPPQPAIPNNAAQNRTHVNILRGNIGYLPFIELKENFTPSLRYGQSSLQTIKTGRLTF